MIDPRKYNLLPCVAILCLALDAGAATAQHAIFVSPSGADSNQGTLDSPIATLKEAQKRVRAARGTDAGSAPITVHIRGGTYAQTTPLMFDASDSGSRANPVLYSSYGDEKVTISGGRRLSGTWRQVRGKPYHALEIPECKDGKWIFHALYVNGTSRQRARWPNWDQSVLRARGRAHGEPQNKALNYYPGDIDPKWTDIQNIDVVQLCSWTPTLHKIREVVPDRRIIRFESTHFRPVDFWEKRFRYYLVGVFEGLDAPGEWYLNRATGVLYYYPMPGEDMGGAEIIAPVVKSTLVHLRGDPAHGRFVENIRFRGIAFKHLDADLPKHDGEYRQGHMFLGAAISGEGIRNVAFLQCEIAQVGEYGIELAAACQGNVIQQCHIWDTGAGGIQLGATDLNALKAAVAAAGESGRSIDNTIDNNFIHRTGTIFHGCYGIVNRFASRSRITHNEISDTHWTAIALDARWEYRGEEHSSGNVIAHNHLHHLGLRYHTDAAGIYQFGPLDTHIHHNHIHHTIAYSGNCGYAGVYLDEQSRGAVVENNLVHDVDWFAYFQHKGTDNVFRNNIGAFARDGFIGRGALNDKWKTNYFLAEGNIYVTGDGQAIAKKWEPGEKAPVLRRNMYFAASDSSLRFAGGTFAEWQALGMDSHSVIGNPGFRDPATRDFTMQKNAPAKHAIAFKPICEELRTAGLYGDPVWMGMPKGFAARGPTPEWTQEQMDSLNRVDFDFEEDPPNSPPQVFRITEDPAAGATIRVTDEVAAKGGKSLKLVDRAKLKKPFYPYMYTAPKKMDAGFAEMSFDVMLDPRQPCYLTFEMRDEKNGASGALLEFLTDGSIHACRKPVFTSPPGTWTHIDVRLPLNGDAASKLDLAIRSGKETRRLSLPVVKPAFREVGWVGFCTGKAMDGVAYLDNVRLTHAK